MTRLMNDQNQCIRACESLNVHLITDQHYHIYSDYSCPISCLPLTTTLIL